MREQIKQRCILSRMHCFATEVNINFNLRDFIDEIVLGI